MDSLSLTAASGMRARMESLELLANNLANASTGGYKSDREFYGLYVSADAKAAELDGTGASPDTQPNIEKHYTDYSQGALHSTENTLDFALSGRGFFAVNGPSGPLYTRNGNFSVSSTGVLVTGDGYPVRTRAGGTIQTKPGAEAIQVQRNGTVIQEGNNLGQLQVDTFDEPVDLNKRGLNYFYRLDASKAVEPAKAEVLQGKLENSNAGPAEGAVRLVSIMRQFEMLQKAMNIGADMNRHAIEEVAKV
jgi:flagellar basal-body rod protein FlgF